MTWINIHHKLQNLVSSLKVSRRCVSVINASLRNLWVTATNGRMAFVLQARGHLDNDAPHNVPSEVLPVRQQDLGQDLDHRTDSNEYVLNCKVQGNERADMNQEFFVRKPHDVTAAILLDVNEDYLPVKMLVADLKLLLEVAGKEHNYVTFFVAADPDAHAPNTPRDYVPTMLDEEGIGVMMTASGGGSYPRQQYNTMRDEYLMDSGQQVTRQTPAKTDAAKLLEEMIGAME
jgi:hypothetical protein